METAAPASFLRKHWPEILLLAGIIFFVAERSFDLAIPFFWDEQGVFARAALHMHDHSPGLLPSALPPDLSRGHPLLFFFLHGVNFTIFGPSVVHARILALAFSVLLLVSLFVTVSKILNRDIAALAVLLLLTQEAFRVQATMMLPEILVCVFLTWSFFFFVKERWTLYAVFSSLAVLTKEPALVVLFGFFLAAVFRATIMRKPGRDRLRMVLGCAAPALIFAVFLLLQKMQNGFWFFPYHMKLITLAWNEVSTKVKDSFEFLLMEQGRLCWLVVISAFMILFFFSRKKLNAAEGSHRLFLVFPAAVLYLLFTVINPFMERYLIWMMEILSLFTAFALYSAFAHRQWIYRACIVLLLVIPFFNFDDNAFRYDVDFSYKDAVKVQQQTIDEFERLCRPLQPVYAQFPVLYALSDSRLGYLSKNEKIETGVLTWQTEFIVVMTPGAFGYEMPEPWNLDTLAQFSSGYAKAFIIRQH